MKDKLATWILKGLVILALLPLVPALIQSLMVLSPLLVGIIALGLGAWFFPRFRLWHWLGRLVSALAAMLGSSLGFLTGWVSFARNEARFMGPFERWRLMNAGHRGFLVDGQDKRLKESVSFESVLTVGGMGRGKSSTFVIPNLLTLQDCSFVVTDSSGEIYDRTSGHLADQGFDVRVLNLMDPSRSETYNPLLNAQGYTEIAQIARIIVDSQFPGNPQDAFWNTGAEKILRVFIQCLRNRGDAEVMNLANLKYLISAFDSHIAPSGQLGKIDQFVMDSTRNDPSTFNDFRGFTVGNPKTMLSFLSTADAALNAIGNPELARLTASSSLDFAQLRQRKTVLYVMVRQQDMAFYRFLLNLFYTDLFGFLLNRVPTASDLPVYMLLDEFGHLQIPGFDVFATTARKYRVGFWIFLQSLSQLESRYGAREAETILDGLQSEIYLPGQNLDTARKLEQRLGRLRLSEKGHAATKPLMSADEIIRMDDKEALFLYSNQYPVKLKTRPYFKQRTMKQKSNRPSAPLLATSSQPVRLVNL